ncbi:nucleoside deaminase [Hymenobacter psychrophilus]|uniref:Cytidine and deoxycytidylate deaminase zinc-binding region n=1 Tax=Hymenobacter psychrophilus TaxID=651662 RepID=A0A1H3M571_9BACT|nr:nucleoside deaminase [Hymenobacter psychrophilus]SDY71388.1 Cytidine and deoxycytidylate deaminase zinc-binding region [Hymenobacter psychrophilus]
MPATPQPFTAADLPHLRHCLQLAEEALLAGDEPFGSVLVGGDGQVLATARNRVNELNNLAHPEVELVRWAGENLSEEERRAATLYTSGEHCPMCAAAHGWLGLGPIVYLSSARQLQQWLQEAGAPAAPINFLPVQELIKEVEVRGPGSGELLEQIKKLQLRYHTRRNE